MLTLEEHEQFRFQPVIKPTWDIFCTLLYADTFRQQRDAIITNKWTWNMAEA